MKLTSSKFITCYDLMNVVYDAYQIWEWSWDLGHVPIIDRNPRGKEFISMIFVWSRSLQMNGQLPSNAMVASRMNLVVIVFRFLDQIKSWCVLCSSWSHYLLISCLELQVTDCQRTRKLVKRKQSVWNRKNWRSRLFLNGVFVKNIEKLSLL